jgi:hypothetical protein
MGITGDHQQWNASLSLERGVRSIADGASRRFTLTVVAPPHEDEAATIRRLRAALKALLRSYRLRCVSILPALTDDAPPAPCLPVSSSCPAEVKL